MKMKKNLTAVLILLPILSFAQENNSILCSDGIDNDNNGLLDCEEQSCITLSNNACSICGDGISFADTVLEYTSGCPLSDPFPQGALGLSDYDGSTIDSPTFTFLGQGGSLKLGFTNNLLSNSGDSQEDLWVFEVGPVVESCDIGLRPSDVFTETQLQLSGILDLNADGYYDFGTISGSTSSIDIDLVLQGYSAGELKFDAIEIKDVFDGSCNSAAPGADIDAVCAIFTIPADCNSIPSVDLGEDQVNCNGSSVQLGVTDSSDLLNATYLWSNGSTNSSLSVSQSGIYWLEIQNSCGTARDSISVEFNSFPEIDLGDNRTVCDGNSIELDVTIPNGIYRWQDGSTNSTFEVQNSGSYWVEAENSCGIVQDTVELIFPEFDGIDIPNVFTPNGDGVNDYFVVDSRLLGFPLKVFQRTGRQVFDSKNYQNDWNGENLPSGVYYWLITNECGSKYKGWVTIIY